MTLSIVARDTKTGDFGVCGYTDIAGYGSLVPHVSCLLYTSDAADD